jgi:hypothetical protein
MIHNRREPPNCHQKKEKFALLSILHQSWANLTLAGQQPYDETVTSGKGHAVFKLVSLAFVCLLIFVHSGGDAAQLLGLPLSMLREEGHAPAGYTLFALLLAIGGLMAHILLQGKQYGQVALFALAALLLLLIALTPSANAFHLFCSLVLFTLLFGYYARLLYHAESALLWVHLAVPLFLIPLTDFHSYGLWQKCFIVYFLLVVNIHHHLLSRELRQQEKRHRRSATVRWHPRKRVIYRLEAGRDWPRGRMTPR